MNIPKCGYFDRDGRGNFKVRQKLSFGGKNVGFLQYTAKRFSYIDFSQSISLKGA
jgi:hypothetical protein